MLRLHVPVREEFAIRQGWLLDPQMMSYNAGWSIVHDGYDIATGCIRWPEREWPAFEERLARPASSHGYFYVADGGAYVGHVHYEVDDQTQAHIGVNVVPGRRGEGLGVQFMELLLERVWQDTSVTVAVNDFEDDRLAAVRLHRRCGFRPDPGVSAAWGKPTRSWRRGRDWTADDGEAPSALPEIASTGGSHAS